MYLHEASPQVHKWAAGKKVKKVLDMDWPVHPSSLCFFPWPLVSEGVFCYKDAFIWCGINIISWAQSSWNNRNRISVGSHVSCLCVCRVRLPTWFLSLTNKVDNQSFWSATLNLPISSTLQSPCLTVDNRVCISTLLLKIKWQLKPGSRLKLVKIVDPTFNVCIIVLCLENAINDAGTVLNWMPGIDNLCTYRAPAGFPVFFDFFEFCTRDTLLQKTDKIHDTGSQSGSSRYQ